jgi:hypothetical protein
LDGTRNGNASIIAVPAKPDSSNDPLATATSQYQEAEVERDDTSDNNKQRLLGKLKCLSLKAKDPDIRQMHGDDYALLFRCILAWRILSTQRLLLCRDDYVSPANLHTVTLHALFKVDDDRIVVSL